jgi:acyl-CoA hydrolase
MSPRRMTPAEAAALVRPRDRLAVPLGPGQPPAFLHALGERDDFEDLRVFGALLTGLYEVFTRRGVSLRSGFFGPVERGLRSSGHDVEFVPADFRRFSRIVRDFHPRILAVQAAMPDEKGMVSFGLHAGAGIEELFAVTRDPDRLLVVEVNPGIPRTVGLPPEHPHAIALDAIDVIIESDAPVFTIGDPEPTAVERAIAEIVAGYVPDGATIQTGIGGIPSAVAGILASGPGGDYGIHTEMFTNGCLALHRAGKVTNRKGVFDGHSIVTFAAGTREVYDYLDGNEDVRFLPVELVNDPAIISRNRRMVSINGALAVDLVGQISADTIDGRQFSGIGGHEDFLQGAAYAEEGRSLVCVPSTATVRGEVLSRIRAQFVPGAVVTGPRHQVDVVVTEHGAAELAGRSVEERAEALLAVADPRFRDALRDEWRELRKRGAR